MQRMKRQEPASADVILKRIVPVLPERDQDDDEREHVYVDPATERQFNVRQSEDGEGRQRFFLEEMVPNGRCCQWDKKGTLQGCWDEPAIKDAERQVGPNGLMAEVRRRGIDPKQMVFTGGSYGVGSIYYASLAECAQAIAAALADNVRYRYLRQISEAERAELDEQEKAASKAYWQGEQLMLEQAKAAEHGLFKGCHSMMGSLSDEVKRDILSYLNAHSEAAWLQIRSCMIVSGTTLWQAWCAFDEAAPRSGRSGHPDPETLRQAIRHAVSQHEETIREKLEERQ